MVAIPDTESQTVEFKKEWTETVKKTMIAFANGYGGTIFFGVDDRGKICGIDFDPLERSVFSFARSGVEPSIENLISVTAQKIDGKTVAVVKIESGIYKPYAFKGKRWDNNGVFIRVGSYTVPAKQEEIIALVRASDPRPWETRPYLSSELTFESAAKIFKEKHIAFSKNHFLGMGLLDAKRCYTNLAYLISDQNAANININFFTGTDNTLIKRVEETGSLLYQMVAIREELDRVNTPFIDKNTTDQSRKDIYPWPQISIREALTNCLAHRDYDSPLQSAINIFQDRIEYLTIGGLPSEISLEEALLPGFSYCRNQRLAELFHTLGWMEKAGSGFSDIFLGYKNSELKPKLETINRTFKIELPKIVPNLTIETKILLMLQRGPQSRSVIEKSLNISRVSTTNELNKLIAEEKVIKEGKGRNTKYALKNN